MRPKKSNKVKKTQTTKKEKSLSAFELMQKEEYERNLKWSLEQCSLEDRARMRSEAQSSTNSNTESKYYLLRETRRTPKDYKPTGIMNPKLNKAYRADPEENS
jgi:hypothetical protein